MNPDGVAYLDIGDAYLRGDWNAAVNGYWSPLYSWILGVAMHLLRPSPRWEFPTVHLINFGIYIVALIAFERFWRELGRWRQVRAGSNSIPLPEWAWLAIGYGLFLYSALTLIRIWSVTPDMLVAVVVYLAAGSLVRIRNGGGSWQAAALLGLMLGVGYLTKAALFPLGFVFLAATALASPRFSDGWRWAAVASLFLLLVAGPYIAVLSSRKGYPTIGDTGPLMYAWHVNAVPHPHWQGDPPGAGTPLHGSKRIFDAPAIYAFGRPAGGTYPIAYDPAYWYEGVTPHFEWAGQIRVLRLGAWYYFDLFFRQLGGLVVALLMLVYLGARATLPRSPSDAARDLGLAGVALAALAMFALVHVQGRYVGAFVVLLWGDLLASIRLAPSEQARRHLSFAGTVMVAVLAINVVAFNFERGGRALAAGGAPGMTAAPAPVEPRWRGEVAEELTRLGLRRGDQVAVIGYGFDSFWARLARVQIVAEMFDWEAESFWAGGPSLQADALQAFAAAGAKAVVAERVPWHVRPIGWHRVGTSDYYIYVLRAADPTAEHST